LQFKPSAQWDKQQPQRDQHEEIIIGSVRTTEYIAKLEGYRKNSMWWLPPENESAAWGRSIQKFQLNKKPTSFNN
jgi:hypothetical protein